MKSGERKRRARKRLLLAQGGVCFYCPRALDETTATLDHLVAKSRGGSNGADNLVVACDRCNRMKKNNSVESHLKVLADAFSGAARARFMKKVKSATRPWAEGFEEGFERIFRPERPDRE
jgi:hypothetical protein